MWEYFNLPKDPAVKSIKPFLRFPDEPDEWAIVSGFSVKSREFGHFLNI